MSTPSSTPQRLREAAETCRTEAAELARHPAPDLTVEYPDLDGAIEHVEAGREMKIRYALAGWLDVEASTWAGDEAHYSCSPGVCTFDAALAVADAILGTPAAPGGAR